MNYSQFVFMLPEVSLILVFASVFLFDFISTGERDRRWFNPAVSMLMLIPLCVCAIQTDHLSIFGGMYVTSESAGVIKTILTLGTIIVLLQSRQWVSRSDTEFREGEFYMLIISTLLGMYMMVSAGHFLLFFVGLEMASVPMACLIAFDKMRKNSAEGAAKFILTAIFSSAVMLYGISFIYGSTGTLYFDDVAAVLASGKITTMSILGLVFFISGLGFKISLVPFHFWTADAYQGAPTTVTGYLSVISKGAAAFTLVVILTKAFTPMSEYWKYVMYILIVLSITVANLYAIRQKDLKRFMAFSSISQAGYIMLAAIGDTSVGIAALSFYVLVYVVANLAVFSVIGVVEQNNDGVTKMDAYDGFYTTNPKLSLIMTFALFSLGGIPPFAGMFSKFFIFMSAAEEGSMLAYAVVFIALINTVVSLYYYLLIVKAMYIKHSESPLPTFKSDCNTKFALALCTIGVIAFGVFSCVYDWIRNAANMPL